jgi:enterochelin esterase-like enzyme
MKQINIRKSIIAASLFIFINGVIAQPPRGPWVVSPEVHADKSVTFRYLAPNAQMVKLSAQFEKAPVEMTKGEQGIWSVTVGPINPDIYPYSFQVDGITVMDPANVAFFPNERFKASLVDIPANNTSWYDIKDVPHGTISYDYYASLEGSTGSLVVYTPSGYHKDLTKKYPVFYLISGTTDTEETFFKVGKVNFIMDNMIAEGKVKPMIIVMPYGNPAAKIAEQKAISKPSDVMNRDGDEAMRRMKLFETDLMQKIIPYVESNYRTVSDGNNRAIGGFSRGGGQTLRASFNNLDKFAWVCSYASYISPDELNKNYAHLISNPQSMNKHYKLLWSGIGTEDFLYKGTTEFNEFLLNKQINLKTYTIDGGHTWMNVKKYLIETLPMLFQP